jgi:hypothetical protein
MISRKLFYVLLLISIIALPVLQAQNVAINTTGTIANSTAILDVDATNMGLLIPRVSLVAVTNGVTPVSGPATSLLVYNTNAAVTGGSGAGYYYWDGTQWVRLFTVAGSSGAWLLTGNTGTNDPNVPATYGTSVIGATENWIGTTDAQDFVIGTNTTERFRVKQTTGYVGIGTAAPSNLLTLNNANTTPGTSTTYPFAILRAGALSYTVGSDASFVYEQSWNSKPLLINSQGNFVGINLTAAPIQNLDVNGRMNVANGVIQRGTTTINITSDLGLYSQVAGNWIRFASNAAPIRFFTDQGGGNGGGTNSIMDVDNANGGGVAITGNMTGATGGTPDIRAILDLQSTTKGVLTPRMTTPQRDAMGGGLAEGLLIYNIDNNCFEYWDTQSNPLGTGGFWNSLCDHCDQVVIISSNQVGFNLNSYLGGAQAKNYCVYVQAGVTLQASGASGSGFNASTMPNGASITLTNYGNILAGGGNGGQGGTEVDGVCAGSDTPGSAGGAGGHAILSNSSVPVHVLNYGVIRAGGGGGGGGGWGCCAAGGGGGGGAGTPAGNGGAANTTNCTSGFVCGCGGSTSAGGAAGTALTGGPGGGGVNRPATSCTCNGTGAGAGGTGGAPGVAGNNGTSGNNGGGGAAGLSLQGNSSGSSMTNFGTLTGAVNP